MTKYKNLFGQKLTAKHFCNRYTISILLFVVWMVFFDKYKVSNSLYLSRTINKLEQSKVDYDRKIAEAQIQRQELEENSEKYAREKYYMHKENEEVFIIEK